jgi:hypothetical protein
MALVPFLRILLNHDLQSELVQPRSIARISRSTVVARHHRSNNWLGDTDSNGCAQQSRRD